MIVTVDEVKAHLRIENDEEDDYLESLIRQAQSAAEDFIREPVSEYSPDAVRLACLLMISYIYENRDVPDTASYNAMRRAFNNLLYPHHNPDLMF